MKVFFFRHGPAEDREEFNSRGLGSDEFRPLTDSGQRLSNAARNWILEQIVSAPYVLCSPLLRAKQTAEGLARKIHFVDWLRPEVEPQDSRKFFLKELEHIREDRIVLVGHEPLLSELVSLLLVGDPKLLPIKLKKAGVVVLKAKSGPAGVLLWELRQVLDPKRLLSFTL